jgi:hypothetical protein
VFLVRASVAAASWRSPLVALALLIAFWFSFPVVAQYAGIWDARANPKPNVEVQLSSTTKMHGELSRTWQGDFQLREDNGALHTFGRDVAVMTFPMPSPDERDRYWTKHWRAYVPPMLLSGGIICALMALVAGAALVIERPARHPPTL